MLFLAVPALAEPAWHQLQPSAANATSFLKSNWNKYDENYHPNYAFDGNPATAWVEGVDGDGVGQVLSWDTSALASARAVKVRFRNGYQKSPVLLAANGAASKVEVTVWQGRQVVGRATAPLGDAATWQDVVVQTGGKGFGHVEVAVVEVRKGSKYADTCLSDVETWVDSDVPYDAKAEAAKAAALKTWIGQRVETARFFAALPQTWPFVGTKYTAARPDVTAAEFEARSAPLRGLAATAASRPTSKPVVKGAVATLPDGVSGYGDLELLRPYLRAGDVTLFESAELVVRRDTHECDGDCWTEVRAFRGLAPDGRSLTVATFDESTRTDGRSVYETHDHWTLQWDAAGQLVTAYSQGASTLDLEEEHEAVLTFRWQGGKIAGIEQLTRQREPAGAGGFTEWYYQRIVWTPST